MKKLLATLLILCAGPVWAEWVQYEGNAEIQFYYDPLTIRGKSIKRVWTKTEETTRDDQGVMSTRILLAFDCQEEKIRFVQVETFSESGLKKPKSNVEGPVNWTYIRPQTIEESLFKLVCGKK